MDKAKGWTTGIVLVALGVLLTIGVLGNVDIFFPGWWTLIIIIPCLIGILTDKEKVGSVVGLIIGVFLLLASLGVVDFSLIWKLVIPILLVGIGISVIMRSTREGGTRDRIRDIEEAEVIEPGEEAEEFESKEYIATFGGQRISFSGKEVKGCRAEGVFGGVRLDFRGAKLKKDAVLKVGAYFGGVEIYVPEDWNVEIASRPFFGGVSDNRKKVAKSESSDKENKGEKKKPTLYIDATCVFGGVEIK